MAGGATMLHVLTPPHTERDQAAPKNTPSHAQTTKAQPGNQARFSLGLRHALLPAILAMDNARLRGQ